MARPFSQRPFQPLVYDVITHGLDKILDPGFYVVYLMG